MHFRFFIAGALAILSVAVLPAHIGDVMRDNRMRGRSLWTGIIYEIYQFRSRTTQSTETMELRGDSEHSEVGAAIAVLEESIRNSPVVLGGVARTPDQANEMIARGYRALVVGSDWFLLERGIASAIRAVKCTQPEAVGRHNVKETD